MLSTFADNGVGIFTPWSWKTGMWETLHLFSRYAKTTKVRTTSSGEAAVSGNSFALTLPFLSTTAVILAGTGTGIEENQPELTGLKSIRIYHNPTSGKFRIHFDDQVPGNITLKFTDIAGNEVLSIRAENNSEIDLSQTALASGMYIVTAESLGYTWHTKLVYKNLR